LYRQIGEFHHKTGFGGSSDLEVYVYAEALGPCINALGHCGDAFKSFKEKMN
jgi:hypothetical protein